jgi:hypothetical protein
MSFSSKKTLSNRSLFKSKRFANTKYPNQQICKTFGNNERNFRIRKTVCYFLFRTQSFFYLETICRFLWNGTEVSYFRFHEIHILGPMITAVWTHLRMFLNSEFHQFCVEFCISRCLGTWMVTCTYKYHLWTGIIKLCYFGRSLGILFSLFWCAL